MNAKVENEKVGGTFKGWGLPWVNSSSEFLVDLCAERGMFLANNYFEYNLTKRKALIEECREKYWIRR